MKFCKVAIDANTCIFWAFLLLIFPIRWMLAFLIAAFFHELLHYAVLAAFQKQIRGIRVGICGIRMEIPALSYIQEMICSMAGPMAGLLLLSVRKWYPELSVCGLLQTIYNLLPIYPLDGGRMVRCIANLLFSESADRICAVIEIVTFTIILLLSLGMRWGIGSLVISCFFVAKILCGKIPCKESFLGVQ